MEVEATAGFGKHESYGMRSLFSSRDSLTCTVWIEGRIILRNADVRWEPWANAVFLPVFFHLKVNRIFDATPVNSSSV
jgi:hypothetical protein